MVFSPFLYLVGKRSSESKLCKNMDPKHINGGHFGQEMFFFGYILFYFGGSFSLISSSILMNI
jgi:hypothetical protein